MLRLATAAEMAKIDSTAQNTFGIPDTILMENAGQTAWRTLSARLGRRQGRSILFLAGKGNNGGDALVMARACAGEGFHRPRIVLSAEPAKGLSRLHLDICRNLGVEAQVWSDATIPWLQEADCIVDGLLGTGISGPAREPVGRIAQLLQEAAATQKPAMVVAVDVPSGLWDGYRRGRPVIQAHLTLTLGLPKRSLYLPDARRLAGEIVPLDIGFPRELVNDAAVPGMLVDEDDLALLIPKLRTEDYKHRRGVVALFAGAPGTLGAGILAATATARSGAGLVRLHVDPDLYPAAASACRSVMVAAVDPASPPDVKAFDAFVAGPGWDGDTRREPLLRTCLDSGLPGVLDAGALSLLPKGYRSESVRHVLTPHAGELSRLLGTAREELLADPLPPMMDLAGDIRGVVMLKSHVTYIVAPDGRYAIYDGVHGAMGTGGTGDVLAGILGAVLARGVGAFEAAAGAAVLHGLTGRRVYSRRGWFLAEDLLPELSVTLADSCGLEDYSRFHRDGPP